MTAGRMVTARGRFPGTHEGQRLGNRAASDTLGRSPFADVDARATGSVSSLRVPVVITLAEGATRGSAEQSITLTGGDHHNGHRLFAIGGVWS